MLSQRTHQTFRTAGTVLVVPLVMLAVLYLALRWPDRVIPRGPLDGGGWTSRTRGWLEFSGFYPAELDEDRAFSWMGPSGRIRLPRLTRSVAHRLSLWLQPAVVGRPVDLTVTVDGLAQPAVRLEPRSQRIDIDLPSQPANRATVTLDMSDTFVPGSQDPRTLGARINAISLEPGDGRLRLPFDSFRSAVLGGLGVGLLLAFTLGTPLALSLGAAAGGWLGFLLAFDGAFLGPYPERLEMIGLSAAAVGILVGFLRLGFEPWGWRHGAGVVALVGVCKLALFFHPMVTVGDSIFHVHRAEVVQRGEYFFTSITPRPFFEFPYPPGLYVAVAPLWDQFSTKIEHARLLRSATIAAECALGLAIYAIVFASWGSRLTAFFASAIFVLVPVGLYTMCTSNLTNSFAQSMFGLGLVAVLGAHLRRGWIAASVGTFLLFAGFLSHFSTFSVGVPLVLLAALVALLGRAPASRRTAVALALSLVVATSASVATYYAHFMPVYQKTVERILAREGADPQRSMVAPVSVKGRRVGAMIVDEFGAALLAAATVGAVRLGRARSRDPLTLGLAAWTAVVVGFWLLGIATAVEMRTSLAAQPLMAVLAAVALAAGQRPWQWVVAAVALAAIVLHAVADWCMCLGIEGMWRM